MLWVVDNLLLEPVGLPQVVIVAVHLKLLANMIRKKYFSAGFVSGPSFFRFRN